MTSENWSFGGLFDQDFNLFDPTSVQSSYFENANNNNNNLFQSNKKIHLIIRSHDVFDLLFNQKSLEQNIYFYKY